MNTSFLSVLTNLLVPCLLAAIAVYGLYKGVPVFDTFLEGAAEGMKISVKILPALVALLTCIGMFKASGPHHASFKACCRIFRFARRNCPADSAASPFGQRRLGSL